MGGDRTILHCDCNGFYASVECLLAPHLWDVPMAVCGDPDSRHGIILAKNQLAKDRGVVTAETIWQAKKKCPNLTLVPPRRGEYQRYSAILNQIYERYTDLVEPFGIDESWLDVTGTLHLFGDGPQIADQIRETVRRETGLTVSVGVSFNKIFAKLGSDYKKPDATTVFSRGNYREQVWPLPVSALLYVGRAVEQTLAKLGIHTIGQLAAADRVLLTAALGKQGGQLLDYAQGREDSPVRPASEPREVKSVGNGMTFRRNLVGEEDIAAGVAALADEVASRLRKQGLLCQTVQVQIKTPEFKSISRQRGLRQPTDLGWEITRAAMDIIRDSWRMTDPIRLITITAAGLTHGAEGQLSLYPEEGEDLRQRHARLEEAMDRVRGRYGHGALAPAAVWGSDIGVSPAAYSPAAQEEGDSPDGEDPPGPPEKP